MISRQDSIETTQLLSIFPAVAILGPRQVGKTTMAKMLASGRPSIYLDLEATADRAMLKNAAEFLMLQRGKLVILDEIQRMPHLFQELRGVIDANRDAGFRTGQFLLLGSASMDLLQQSSESLAGRIAYTELTPIRIPEFPEEINRLWLRGGFPDSLVADDGLASFLWRQNFIKTYLERDIPQLGPRIPAERLRRFWTMLAHLQGAVLNASNMANALDVDSKTVANYLDLMVDLLLVRRLEPYYANIGKRLIKSPKVYVRDSGLMHALLGIRTQEELLASPVNGQSWEGFVVENIINSLDKNQYKAFYYRTSSGNEIDLLLEDSAGELTAIEVKRTVAPKVSRGLRQAVADLKPTQTYMVCPAKMPYPLDVGITAISPGDLINQFANLPSNG